MNEKALLLVDTLREVGGLKVTLVKSDNAKKEKYYLIFTHNPTNDTFSIAKDDGGFVDAIYINLTADEFISKINIGLLDNKP